MLKITWKNQAGRVSLQEKCQWCLINAVLNKVLLVSYSRIDQLTTVFSCINYTIERPKSMSSGRWDKNLAHCFPVKLMLKITLTFSKNTSQWATFKLQLPKLRGIQLLFTHMVQFHAMSCKELSDGGLQWIHIGNPEESQNERKKRWKKYKGNGKVIFLRKEGAKVQSKKEQRVLRVNWLTFSGDTHTICSPSGKI